MIATLLKLAAAETGESGSMLVGILVLGLGVFFYFLPTIIAGHRGHPNMSPIWVVNLLLGWTVLGWVVALAWSLTAFNASKP